MWWNTHIYTCTMWTWLYSFTYTVPHWCFNTHTHTHTHIYYILLRIFNNKCTWNIYRIHMCMVYKYYVMAIIRCVFDCMKYPSGSNMPLNIDYQYILYYHMDAYRLIMTQQSYFRSPNYLVIQRVDHNQASVFHCHTCSWAKCSSL